MHRSKKDHLFDHFVSAGEQRRRDRHTERLCGFQVDHQIEFGWLLHRQIARIPARASTGFLEAIAGRDTVRTPAAETAMASGFP